MLSLLPTGQLCFGLCPNAVYHFPVCGQGMMTLGRMARAVASFMNTKRREKGLVPRPTFHFISPYMQIILF